MRPPWKDERDAELVYLGGRAPGGPDRGRSSRSPRLPAWARWLSSRVAPGFMLSWPTSPDARLGAVSRRSPRALSSFAVWRMVAWEARDETLAAPGLGSTCPWRGH